MKFEAIKVKSTNHRPHSLSVYAALERWKEAIAESLSAPLPPLHEVVAEYVESLKSRPNISNVKYDPETGAVSGTLIVPMQVPVPMISYSCYLSDSMVSVVNEENLGI